MLSNELVGRLTKASRRTPSAATARSGVPGQKPPISLAPSAPELRCGLEVEAGSGVCWRIDAPVEEWWPEQQRWLAALTRRAATPAIIHNGDTPHPEIHALRHALPDHVALIHVEAVSDASSSIFLAGALHTHKGLPMVTQLLARQAAEEAPLLAALDEILAGKECLITFNGKATVVPRIHARRAAWQMPRAQWSERLTHCDLMPHARRRWESRFPDCKLQTLEQYVCGRYRMPRAAAATAATAWEKFIQHGDMPALESALHHHALDIVTLWQLALWLAHA